MAKAKRKKGKGGGLVIVEDNTKEIFEQLQEATAETFQNFMDRIIENAVEIAPRDTGHLASSVDQELTGPRSGEIFTETAGARIDEETGQKITDPDAPGYGFWQELEQPYIGPSIDLAKDEFVRGMLTIA